MADILFKKPDGSFVTVDSSEAEAAQGMGYVPTTREAMKASEQTLGAGLEGALRGATLGLSDYTLPAWAAIAGDTSLAEAKQGASLRRTENPWAAGLGEAAGAVGMSLATGGGISALAGGGIKGAAVESGLYGLSTAFTENALEDKELLAESLAARMAGGALAGGAVAGALKGVGMGASAVVRKFGGGGLKGTLEEAATQAESRQLLESSGKAESKLKARGGNMRDVVRIGREKDIINAKAGMNEATVKKAEAALDQVGDETADLMKRLDPVKPLKNDAFRRDIVARVESALDTRFADDIVARREAADFIKTEFKEVLEQPTTTWPSLYKLQSRLRAQVSSLNSTSTKREVYDAGRKELRNIIFSEASALGADVTPRLQTLQKEYAALAFLRDVVKNRAERLDATGGALSMGLGGMLAAGAGAGLGGVGGAIGGAIAMRTYRERGGFLLGSALRSLADSKVTSGASKFLHGRIGQVLSLAPEALGAYRYPLAKAAAIGADEAVSEYVRLASQPGGEQLTSMLGLENESPAEVEQTGQRISTLDAIQAAADEQHMLLTGAADGLLGAKSGRPAKFMPPRLTAKDFSKVQSSLRGLLMQPEKLFEMDPEIQAFAPATASMTAATVLRGAQFLDSKAPKSPYEGMPVSVAPQWQPSQADLDRFNRYKEAVENPAKVLQNMANGYMSPEQVEAMKAVYPRLYSDLQQRLGERLAEMKKPLTYGQKMSLSLLMGPTALGMSQQQMQILQAAQAGAGPAGGGMRKPDGRQSVDAQDNQETQAQRLESRG